MSRNYKFNNPEGTYFISFAVVYRIDLFVREIYNNCVMDIQESRKKWLLKAFKKAARGNSNNTKYQLWQQYNQPIELWRSKAIQQKLDYLYNNPIASGFVNEP